MNPNSLIPLFKRIKTLNDEKIKLFNKGTIDINEINVLIDIELGSLILDKCIEEPR